VDKQVVVYTSAGCPFCVKVKEQLKAWNIPYTEKNTSENREYLEELRSRKLFGTPVTFIGNRFVMGFQPEKMRNLLGLDETDAPAGEASGGAAGTGAAAAGNASGPAAGTTKDDASGNPSPSANDAAGQAAKAESGAPLFGPATGDLFDDVFDFAVIGGGPAGASAAMYAARARLKTVVIDKAPNAGTLAITHKIANYPGMRGDWTGLALLTEMQRHAADFGARLVRSQVLGVDFSDPDVKKLELPEGTLRARSVFIAVGAKAPGGKIEGEEEFTGRGVSYCSTCDAAFFEGRRVVVAGDTEEAVHEAETLAKFCKEVRLLVPLSAFKGEADTSRLERLPNVSIHYKHRIVKVEGDAAVERIVIQNDKRETETWDIDGVFLFLAGLKPGTDFLKDAVQRDEEGYVTVDDELRTNVPGVFAGGDARRTFAKQAVISAADGCIAALGADKYVNGRSVVRMQYS
jgi:thioredoxin reductase (NADPH)